MPGITSAMIKPVPALTAGARMAWPASRMTASTYASLWLCGTARIQSSRKRLFGLTNSEGNHGEDVKEYYFYLDSTPTHSYMKYLYKYPQEAFPYEDLVRTNRCRSRDEMEYELLDTGIFGGDRYFDVFVEYAKSTPEDILIQLSVVNRGLEAAAIHLLPSLWFRNTWTWWPDTAKPSMGEMDFKGGHRAIAAHSALGDRFLYLEGDIPLLFTENETNNQRIFGT